jgi:transcriptional regulator GlxA family with amidase domain
MDDKSEIVTPTEVLIVAVPETAGSALYGMLDVLSAAGSVWQELTRSGESQQYFRVRVVAASERPFTCGNGIPVSPDCSVASSPDADIIILPEMWLGPDEALDGRHAAIVRWIRDQYELGANVYSACSGAVMLAETGLLDGRTATSHWGYKDLFRQRYPQVDFDPAPNLCYADRAGRIVTAGGVTSWHDLALHIISRHANPGEALRIAKVYLLKWHDEGDLPYANLVSRLPHNDAIVQDCEDWLEEHYLDGDAIAGLVANCDLPERTLKRRFKAATGSSLIDYLQNRRIEQGKRLLESTTLPVEEISEHSGYSDASFFRRVFKRLTGLTPSNYRRMFAPLGRTEQSGGAS